jgi:hypothetical protein
MAQNVPPSAIGIRAVVDLGFSQQQYRARRGWRNPKAKVSKYTLDLSRERRLKLGRKRTKGLFCIGQLLPESYSAPGWRDPIVPPRRFERSAMDGRTDRISFTTMKSPKWPAQSPQLFPHLIPGKSYSPKITRTMSRWIHIPFRLEITSVLRATFSVDSVSPRGEIDLATGDDLSPATVSPAEMTAFDDSLRLATTKANVIAAKR